jgi:hypothetical protein
VALDPALPGSPLVGVAHCVHLAGSPDVADAAVTVIDSHQGRGLGTLLIELLGRWTHERAAGSRASRVDVLASNQPTLELLGQLGARTNDQGAGTVSLEVSVPKAADDLPATPAGLAIRAAARGDLTLQAAEPAARA